MKGYAFKELLIALSIFSVSAIALIRWMQL